MASTYWATHSKNFQLIEKTLEISSEDLDIKSANTFRDPPEKVKPFLVGVIVETAKSVTETITTTCENDEDEESSNGSLQGEKAENTEHMELYQKVMKYIRYSVAVFGPRLNYNWKLHKALAFWWAISQTLLIWYLITYTLFKHISQRNHIRILEPLALVGQSVACSGNMYLMTVHHHRVLALYLNFEKTCRLIISGKRADILATGLRRVIRLLIVYVFGLLACASFFMAVPIKSLIFDHKKLPFMPLEVTFCDQSTNSGFVIANMIMSELGLLSALGSNYYGSIFFVAISFYTIKVALIGEDFKDLDKMWDGKNEISVAYKRQFLQNICLKFQDMNEYLRQIKTVFESYLFRYFAFNYLSQILCLFQAKRDSWQSGYSLAFAIFLQMVFICLMGTEIPIAKEKLRHMVCDTNWYTYDRESKFIMLQLLNASLDTKEIMLGPIGPLNVVTGISIIKSICSYYTVMSELF